MNILVTGAAGYLGRLVVEALAQQVPAGTPILATDLKEPPVVAGVDNRVLDIRDPGLAQLMAARGVDTVLHLAAIVTPPPGATRQFLHDVEVGGTHNVLAACVTAGVRRFIYTSSGAAYGYHADNAPLLDEDQPLRGNDIFAYACHKRLIEEQLARYRTDHPQLSQLVFRVSTILGASVDNQITAMFERPVVVGVQGADTPFCLVWDQDVVRCLVEGALSERSGTYNLTGDGVMTLREIAHALGHRYVALPVGLMRRSLALLSRRGWSPYGPEQVMFLQYRPVLTNQRLKSDFGYTPRKTTRQVFELYRDSRATTTSRPAH